MTYQASVAYPAAGAGPWAGAEAAHYAQQYYASYGYGGGYDMSAYYQHQHYAAAAPVSGAYQYQDLKTHEASDAPPPPAPPSSKPEAPASAASSTTPPGAASAAAPPPPPEGDPPSPPPPPPPPPLPPSGAPEGGNGHQQTASIAPVAPAASNAATTANASVTSYDPAYANWFAQNYGGYYGYPGYEQHMYSCWQQQQPAEAYAYASHSYAQAQPQPQEPPGQLSISHQSSAQRPEKPPASPATAAVPDSYQAVPPPSGLYSLTLQKGSQSRHRTGATGTNTVPIGPRPPQTPLVSSQSGPPQPFVIRPQVPSSKRSTATASPAYISVGLSSSSMLASATVSVLATSRNDPTVAAAVAAGAASAMAAASAAKSVQAASSQASTQFPPSFTAWVTRCFNMARLKSIPDNRLSEKLMAYLDQVKAEGKLWTTDWDTLPVLLSDSPGDQKGASASASNQVLPLGELQTQKRSRWGAVPEGNSGSQSRPGQDQQYPSRQHEHHHSHHRKRSYTAESDDEGHVSGKPESSSSLGLSPHAGWGAHTMSNRKRKKLLQLEQKQHHVGRKGGLKGLSAEELRRQARAGRFGDGRAAGAALSGSHEDDSSGADFSDDEEAAARRFGGIVVGTCQALEKSYFRLTSQPDPATVRPEPVLERALERLVSMIARGEASYFYSLDQFKGMRQDCTVQHLRNALAVRVYEAHARSSLEYGDTAEFNQCQARLGHLYGEGQPGCVAEFTAYRLLYETVHCATAGGRGGGMAKALLHTMRNVSRDLVGTYEIRHALLVREAVMTNNYAAFFRLYSSAPHLGRAIMDVVAEPMRWAGLNAFVRACDLPLPVGDVAQLLGFVPRPPSSECGKSDESAKPLPGCMRAHLAGDAAAAPTTEQGVEECTTWLREHGAVVVDKGTELLLDAKASRGKLFAPEVTAKVAHGDENLSVNDFLSQAQRTLAVPA